MGQGGEGELSRTLAFRSTLPVLAGTMEGLLFLSSAAQFTGTRCSGGLPFALFVVSCGKRGSKKSSGNPGSIDNQI